MEIEEFNVWFVIKIPKRPPQLIVTYLCVSEEHFQRSPDLKREEVIARNSLFLLADQYEFEPGVVIKMLRYKSINKLNNEKRRLVEAWKNRR